MKDTIKKRIFRVACMLTATVSLIAFSGCDAMFSYLDALLSSSESGGDVSEESSVEDSSVESAEQSSADSSVDSAEDSQTGTQDGALDFSPSVLTEKYGYQYFAQVENAANLQKFYKDLYDVCVRFYNSTSTISSTHYNGDVGTVYEIGGVDFGQYGLSQAQAVTVWNVAMVEFPEFYWIAHRAFSMNNTFNLCIDGEYATYQKRVAVQNALEQTANECYAYIPQNASQTEKAMAISDYVIGNLDYAYENDGVTAEDAYWAHNIEGLTLQKGVCETYAKAYAYLCGLMDVNCLTVTGVAGKTKEMGGHAWNIVEIDGVWYTMDTTWEDAYDHPQKVWLGVPATEFATTHIPNTPTTHGNTWLYGLPTLTENKLMPVSVSENNGAPIYYPNLDSAFADMQNASSTYVVDLCPETAAARGEGVSQYPYDITFTTKTLPQTAGLTLKGKRISTTTKTVVTAKNSITVSSAVTITYATIRYPFGSSGTSKITLGTQGNKEYAI